MIELTPHASGVVIGVRAQAGARRDAILGEQAGSIKVSVTDAPEKGKANQAIVELLCASLGLRKSQVALLSGKSSRNKRFLVSGLSTAELREKLRRYTIDPEP